MEIFIESKLVLDHPTLSAFYYYCRAQDTKGQGWVRLAWTDLIKFFGKTKQTIRRWIKDSLKMGFMRNVEFHPGYVWLRYVAKSLIKAHTGGCVSRTRVVLEVLKRTSSLKAAAYEAALIAQQQRCLKAVERQHGGTNRVVIPKQRVRRSSNAHGCDHISAQGTYWVKPSRTAIGAKQNTVAIKLGRSRATLQRNSKHIQRSAMYQGVKEKDRPGYYIDYIQAEIIEGYPTPTKERMYRRAPNYYHSSLEVYPERAVYVEDPWAATLKANLKAAQQDQIDQESINYLLTSRKVALRSLEAQLHQNLTVAKLRLLAHAILWHFKQTRLEVINQLAAPELVQMIMNLEQVMSKDEWALVQLMGKRVQKGKLPLPQGIKPGELLIHITSAKERSKELHEVCTSWTH